MMVCPGPTQRKYRVSHLSASSLSELRLTILEDAIGELIASHAVWLSDTIFIRHVTYCIRLRLVGFYYSLSARNMLDVSGSL